MRRCLVLCLAATLSACAVAAPGGTGSVAPQAADPLDAIAKFTLTDLQHAEADAKAHADKVAEMCYAYLASQLEQKSAGAPNGTIAGAISAFQKGRDLLRTVSSGISDDFQVSCAPLLSDARLNLLRLGVLGGGAAATGGILP